MSYGGTNHIFYLILCFCQRHAELFAKDVPPSKVVRIIDRFLAYYIMTADRLQRTARWIENMEGGIEVEYFLLSVKHF